MPVVPVPSRPVGAQFIAPSGLDKSSPYRGLGGRRVGVPLSLSPPRKAFHALRMGHRPMRNCFEQFFPGPHHGGAAVPGRLRSWRARRPALPGVSFPEKFFVAPEPFAKCSRRLQPALAQARASCSASFPPRRGAIHCAPKGFDESNPYRWLGGGSGKMVGEPPPLSPPNRIGVARRPPRLLLSFLFGR
jgi:hypothetical protein